MTEKTYYSLRFLGTNAFHTKGYQLKTTNSVLNIGETTDCEIRYEASEYEPELYATILQNEDGKSWRLIRRSPHVEVKIAGTGGFGYIHQLKDGDVICFDGQDLELEFHVHHDCNYGSTAVVIEQHKSTRLLYGIISAAVLAMVGLVFFLNYGKKGNELKYEDLKKFESSVYIIKVDSVQRLNIIDGDTTLIHPTKVLHNEIPIGTAFLTNDGKLITARHCVEYWIGDKIDLNTEVDTLDDDDIIKWAILTETYMYQREDEGEDAEQTIRVFCSVYDKNAPSEPKFTFSSTDANVHINTENDDIVEMADLSDNYYWRTVRPYYVDRSMELGDIIYVDVPEKGNIVLADSNTLKKIDPSTKVAILGFGANSSLKNEIIPAEGTMKMTVNNYHLDRSLVFEANITHGHSGGPVFIQDGSDIIVAGVVSKVDIESDGTLKMAVPITEITNMANQPEK